METVDKKSRKSVAIVGGASLVGSHLVEQITARRPNWETTILDVAPIETAKFSAKVSESSRVQYRHLDVRMPDVVRAELRGKDVVFHMAALLSMAFPANVREAVEVNILGAINVVDACCSEGCRLIISSSAGGVYGRAPSGYVTEETPFWHDALIPGTAMYGSAKILVESYCRDRSERANDLEWVALRYTSVYGRRQHNRGRNTANLRENLIRLHRGECAIFDRPANESHDYVNARDVAMANVLASEAASPLNRAYTIGAGRSTSNAELDEILRSVTGSRAPTKWLAREEQARPDVTFDLSRAERELGYLPQVLLEDGIAELYREVREEQDG